MLQIDTHTYSYIPPKEHQHPPNISSSIMAPSTNHPSSSELQSTSKSLAWADQQKRVSPGVASLGVVSDFTVVYKGNTRTGPPPKESFEGMDEWVKGASNAEKQEENVEVKEGSALKIELKK
jgi:hypothetical protein